MYKPDMLYKCLNCGNQETVKANDHETEGRMCKNCGGHLIPADYIGVGLEYGIDKISSNSIVAKIRM